MAQQHTARSVDPPQAAQRQQRRFLCGSEAERAAQCRERISAYATPEGPVAFTAMRLLREYADPG